MIKPMKMCSRDGCNQPKRPCGKQLCEDHYQEIIISQRVKSTCEINGCGEQKVSGSGNAFCQLHYDEFHERKQRKPACKLDGCEERKMPGTGSAFCQQHYDEFHAPRLCDIEGCGQPAMKKAKEKRCRDHHDFSGITVDNRVCRYEGCEERVCQGSWKFCERHYDTREMRRYGRNHARVRAARGAPSQYECILCPDGKKKMAEDWATIQGTSGAVPDEFMPLCRQCHVNYDGIGEKSAAARRGQKRSDETRTLMSELKKGKPWTDAQRAARESVTWSDEARIRHKEAMGTPERREGSKQSQLASWQRRRENGTDGWSPERRARAEAKHQRDFVEGPDGKPMRRSVYEDETGQPCGIT